MNEINLDNLNKLAMASNLINETMRNCCNTEIDILKTYVKNNLEKCQRNYAKIIRFIDEHKDMFYDITNTCSFTVKPLNGLTDDAFGFKRFISNGKFTIVLELNNTTNNISTYVELDESIFREYFNPHFSLLWMCPHHWDNGSIINFNVGDIEHWTTQKKKIDNYIAYTERIVKEFENMVCDIVNLKMKKIEDIFGESKDALSNIARVKEITITYGV